MKTQMMNHFHTTNPIIEIGLCHDDDALSNYHSY
jgi:hypothetical protein